MTFIIPPIYLRAISTLNLLSYVHKHMDMGTGMAYGSATVCSNLIVFIWYTVLSTAPYAVIVLFLLCQHGTSWKLGMFHPMLEQDEVLLQILRVYRERKED